MLLTQGSCTRRGRRPSIPQDDCDSLCSRSTLNHTSACLNVIQLALQCSDPRVDYDGKTLKGTIDLEDARTIPVPATCSFEIHTSERVFYLQTESSDPAEAHDWVLQLQCCGVKRLGRKASRRRTETVVYQIGDELLPITRSPSRHRSKAWHTSGQVSSEDDVFSDIDSISGAPSPASPSTPAEEEFDELAGGGFRDSSDGLRHSWPLLDDVLLENGEPFR